MPGAYVPQGRSRRATAIGHMATTWRKRTSGRQRTQVRRLPLDRDKPLVGVAIESRHGRHQATCVGMAGAGIKVSCWRGFHHPSCIHDHDAIGIARDNAEVMRDQNQSRAGASRKILQQIKNLRLYGHVKCGSRLIGDDQLRFAGECHCNHGALAQATGELMWVSSYPGDWIRHANEREQVACLIDRLSPGNLSMLIDRFSDLQANRESRIERTHRFLKDHRDAVAAHAPDLRVA